MPEDLFDQNISDDELHRRLKESGVDVGPITATTRRVYIKKLAQIEHQQKKSLNGKDKNSNFQESQNGNNENIEDFQVKNFNVETNDELSKKASHQYRNSPRRDLNAKIIEAEKNQRKQSPRLKSQKKKSPLNSEDSDVEFISSNDAHRASTPKTKRPPTPARIIESTSATQFTPIPPLIQSNQMKATEFSDDERIEDSKKIQQSFTQIKKSSTNQPTKDRHKWLRLIFLTITFALQILIANYLRPIILPCTFDYSLKIQDSKLINGSNSLNHQSDLKPALEMMEAIQNKISLNCCQGSIASVGNLMNFKFEKSNLNDFKVNREGRDQSLSTYSDANLLEYDYSNVLKLITINEGFNLKVGQTREIFLNENYFVNLPMFCCLKIKWSSNFWPINIAIGSALALAILNIRLLKASIMTGQHDKNKKLGSKSTHEYPQYDFDKMAIRFLIKKTIELLKERESSKLAIPVAEIRDNLLTPALRETSTYQKIWKQVINDLESRPPTISPIKMETKFNENGESIKCWKWNGQME